MSIKCGNFVCTCFNFERFKKYFFLSISVKDIRIDSFALFKPKMKSIWNCPLSTFFWLLLNVIVANNVSSGEAFPFPGTGLVSNKYGRKRAPQFRGLGHLVQRRKLCVCYERVGQRRDAQVGGGWYIARSRHLENVVEPAAMLLRVRSVHADDVTVFVVLHFHRFVDSWRGRVCFCGR